MFAGVALMLAVVQLAVIRSFHWLRPVFAAAGVAVLLAGLASPSRRSGAEATSHDRRS